MSARKRFTVRAEAFYSDVDIVERMIVEAWVRHALEDDSRERTEEAEDYFAHVQALAAVLRGTLRPW